MIKQNVVFVENKAGSLKRVTGIIADNGINIYGFACFDGNAGIISMRNPSATEKTITFTLNDAIGNCFKQEWIYESYYTGDRS